MSQNFTKSYFCLLSDEILLKILRDIDSLSLLNFCEVYERDNFMQEKKLIRTIDLNRKYGLTDISQISKKIAFEHVTTLNINCVYWVPAYDLRPFIAKLINLETLYAIYTDVSLSSEDVEIFNKLKIKKLGISMRSSDHLGLNKIPSVETLYITVVPVKQTFKSLGTVFPRVTKLWIDVDKNCKRQNVLRYLNPESKNKFFFQVNGIIPVTNLEAYWPRIYYSNQRAHQPYVICSENFTAEELRIFEEREAEILGTTKSWIDLQIPGCAKPYGPKDARRLCLIENTLDNILFEELNFYHYCAMCTNTSREIIESILQWSGVKRLKKLCVMMCLLTNRYTRQTVNVQESINYSQKRIRFDNSASSHSVGEIFTNFLGLKHLEIYVCHSTFNYSALRGYTLISLFENLEVLTLEIPLTIDGVFLIEVLKKCKCLQRLKIMSPDQHEHLNNNLYTAIVNAVSLEDFRYENPSIDLDKLMQRLCLIDSENLKRIVLVCNKTENFSVDPLKDLLDRNPQLVFLYFQIEDCNEADIKMVQQTLNSHMEKHPSKVFIAKKKNVFNRLAIPIPSVHSREMVKHESNVGNLYVLDDFASF